MNHEYHWLYLICLPILNLSISYCKLNDLYQKIISLPGRAKTMKDLGESLRVLVTLERQAFGLDNVGADGEAQNGPTKQLTDAERAVRLSRLMSGNPEALAVFLAKVGGNGA